jgi:outer membrane PBP1 activator LpoA protein
MIKLSPALLRIPCALALSAAAAIPATAQALQTLDGALAQARAALARGDRGAAADAYEDAALSGGTRFANDYHLLAAETAMDGNQPAHAAVILDRLPFDALDAHQKARLQLVRARIALSRNDSAGALQALPAKPDDPTLAPQMLLLRARALFATGDATGATATLVQRERWLAPDALEANRAEIWKGLLAAPRSALGLARAGAADPITRGWLELATLSRNGASLENYDDWRKRYPGHPASDRLASLMLPVVPTVPAAIQAAVPTPVATASAATIPTPAASAATPGVPPVPVPLPVPAGSGNAALLLPLSGPFAAAGGAVRDGFVAVQRTQTYDTGTTPQSAVDAYRQATAAGASLIVGPLRKEDATAVLAVAAPGAAQIVLNEADAGTKVPPNVLQFGLSPEDEARAAAEDAAAHGLKHAVALVPSGDWGDRVFNAFRGRFEELQGTIVDSAQYAPGKQDFSEAIKHLLKYDASIARFRTASSALGMKMEFNPRRRADIDFIFIGARAVQARLIVAQFRFYRAESLPIYGTSSVYDGVVDADLQGVRFCDVPAIVTGGGSSNGQPVDILRLNALGHDAALLAQALHDGHLAQNTPIDGTTGRLSLDANGVIHRQLACVEMADGALHSLSPQASDATPAPPASSVAPPLSSPP